MASYERTFLLQVPSSTENLAMIRDFVNGIGARAGMNPKEIAEVEMAVDEACANVIEHAYGRDVTKEVIVRAVIDESEVVVEVVDTGRGFEPASIEQVELKDLVAKRASGGLGMRLIRKLMDEVDYQIVPGVKNELKMIKKLKRSQ